MEEERLQLREMCKKLREADEQSKKERAALQASQDEVTSTLKSRLGAMAKVQSELSHFVSEI